MRITESRMVDVATQNMIKARTEVSDAAAEVSSGRRIERPSDDPAAWATGRRASSLTTASNARGTAIAGAQERLNETDGALGSISEAMARAKELAVQGSNASYSAEERKEIAIEIRALRGTVLNAANSRGASGEYIFAGSRGDQQPFDSVTGAYSGDAYQREVETAAGGSQAVTIPGSRLTAAGGVDILASLQSLADALDANDVPGIQTAMGGVDSSVKQVARARSEGGALASSLQIADDSRRGLELILAEIEQRAVASDPIQAASRLTQAATALQTAQALTNRIVEIARPK